MLHRAPPLLALLSLSLVSGAHARPPASAREAAIAALAAGRPAEAASRLRSSEDPEDRCLRGRALLQAGEPEAARKLLAEVPAGAACAPRAAFDAAEALRASGDLDGAARRYAALAAPLLGDDRDREVVDWLQDFARRLLARPAHDRDDAAFGLYRLALDLQRAPAARRALAEEVAQALVRRARTDDRETAEAVVRTLVAIDVVDSALLAPLLPGAEGVALLPASTPATPGAPGTPGEASTRLLRIQLAARADRTWAALLAEPETDEAARWLRAEALGEAGEHGAIEALAPFVESSDRPRAARASKLHATSLVAHGELEAARAAWQRHHQRFPGDREDETLTTLELQLARQAATRGDFAGARTLYDALAQRLSPDAAEARQAAVEAAWMALAAGERDDATRRFEALAGLEEFAVSEAGAQGLAWLAGLAEGRVDAARAVLRGLGGAGAAVASVLAELDRPALHLGTRRQRPGGAVSVQVQVRNLEEIEVRLHRIDPVAYVESGGTPSGLPRLDTAVIAPDRSWKTAVPAGGKPGQLHAFDLPLPGVKAGLYRVTVAGPTIEASAVLLVSDLNVVAHRAAGALAVAVFRDGKPVSGARLRARLGDRTVEGRSDARGLARLETPEAAGVLLVEDDGAPALLTLSGAPKAPERAPVVTLHFDRPAYLPGDVADFRLVASEGGKPLANRSLKVAVLARGRDLPRNADQVLTTDARGVAVGTVALPHVEEDVRVQVLDGEKVRASWTLPVRRRGVGRDRATVRFDAEGQAIVTVLGADGLPRVGAEVRALSDADLAAETASGAPAAPAPLRTDAQGQVRFAGPPAPVPWSFEVRVDGAVGERHSRSAPAVRPLSVAHRPGPAGSAGTLQIEGSPGPVTVRLLQRVSEPSEIKAPSPPWPQAAAPRWQADRVARPDADPPSDDADDAELGRVPVDVGLRLRQRLDLVLSAPATAPGTPGAALAPGADPGADEATTPLGRASAPLAADQLPPGRYLAQVIAPDGRGWTPVATTEFVVAGPQAPRLLGVRDLVPGERLAVRSADGPVLVVARRGHQLLGFELASTDRDAVFDTTAWSDTVHLLAARPDGRLSEVSLTADRGLSLTAAPTVAAGAVRVRGQVLDAAGRPVPRASVLVSLYDRRLVESEPGLRTHDVLADLHGLGPAGAGGRTVVAVGLRHQIHGTPIDPALLAETARAQEARSALAAARGDFGGSKLKAMALEEIAIEQQQSMGGMGFSGAGRGGGGSGIGRMSSARMRVSEARHSAALAGHRERVLFAVVDTDAEGRFEAVGAHPRAHAPWRLEVAATTGALAGGISRGVALTGPALRAVTPSPGRPGETASLVVGVDAPPAGAQGPFTLVVDDRRIPLDLPAEGGPRVVGSYPAGSQVRLSLLGAQDAPLDTLTWSFPVAAGLPVAEGGDVLRVLAAAGGGFPAARLALDTEPAEGTHQFARSAPRCLALLAARPSAHPSERPALDAALARAVLEVAGWQPLRSYPESVLCLNGAQALGVQLGPVVETHIPSAEAEPATRAFALYVRAVVGQTIDEAVLARMARNAEGPTRGLLARTLVALKRAEEATPLADLDDVQGILARRALGKPRPGDLAAARALPLPPPTDAARADFIAAAAGGQGPGDAKGTAPLRALGRDLGPIDRAAGFDLRLPLPAGAAPEASAPGVPGLWVVREGPRGAPAGPAGKIHRLRAEPDGEVSLRLGDEAAPCGDAKRPCRLAVGDAVFAPGVGFESDGSPPPGFRREGLRNTHQQVLRALHPATGVLRLVADVRPNPPPDPARGPVAYEIVPAGDPQDAAAEGERLAELSAGDRIPWAEAALRRGGDPEPWLRDLPEKDLNADHLAALAQVRFQHALARPDTAPAELVDRFEAVRERAPRTTLSFAALARIAEAYRAAGQPGRAVDGWRAALGGVFLTQAATFRRAEGVVGALAAFRGLHGLAARYPAVPAVGSALFHLPQQVSALADDGLPDELVEQGVTPTDLRLLAAEWDRAYLADWPAGAEGAQVGFHLARTLYELRADAEAARWAATVAARFPKAPERDGLLLLEGLALARSGEEKAALDRFNRVASETFTQADGTEGPSGSREDAHLAAGRVHEARGDFKAATAAYLKGGEGAAEERAVLERVQLRVEPLVVLGDEDPVVEATLANLPEVRARAYRVDLRTLFVRDGGLAAARNLEITGVSPTFTGTLKGHAGPHPRTLDLKLPLKGRGAWLVQLDGEGAPGVSSLVVRSRLTLHATDDGRQRRAAVTRADGRPAAGIETRIHNGSTVSAERTDVRGVVTAGPGAAILAFDGDDVAFTPAVVTRVPAIGAPAPAHNKRRPSYEENLDRRLRKQVQDNRAEFEEQFDADGVQGIEASTF